MCVIADDENQCAFFFFCRRINIRFRLLFFSCAFPIHSWVLS